MSSWRGILSGVPRTSPDDEKVVPIRPPSLDEMMTELRAYDAKLLEQRIEIDRRDRAHIQQRNQAAEAFNALLGRAIEARSRVADHLKTFGMAVEFPHTPDVVPLIETHTPSEPLRRRGEFDGDE